MFEQRWVQDPAPMSELPEPVSVWPILAQVVGWLGVLLVVGIIVAVVTQ